jgi:hypothetical protein
MGGIYAVEPRGDAWAVVNTDTGVVVVDGLTRKAADKQAALLNQALSY